jgi:hypothetical protein
VSWRPRASRRRLARKLVRADLGQLNEESGVHECLLLLCTKLLYQKL